MEQQKLDRIFMGRCLELAQKGMGHVAPNPMVGAVVVYNNTIIGEGFHKEYGHEHAERVAINPNRKSLLSRPPFLSLEPCSTLESPSRPILSGERYKKSCGSAPILSPVQGLA